MDNAQLINQTSGKVEYYTPSYIIEAARAVMGSIDIDPASCALANETVQAQKYFTIEDDGLNARWRGYGADNVWLNHPFGRKTNKPWIEKAGIEYTGGYAHQICLITFACTSEQWFQPLFNYPICFLSPRVNYLGLDGKPVKGVTKGSCVTYMGKNLVQFCKVFDKLGTVVIPFVDG